jgi:putative SOS response-associated peptidase YedK
MTPTTNQLRKLADYLDRDSVLLTQQEADEGAAWLRRLADESEKKMSEKRYSDAIGRPRIDDSPIGVDAPLFDQLASSP